MACASTSRSGRRAAGMTLVEILVALGLTGLLVSVALAVAQSQAMVYREQVQSHKMEENLRGAMALLTRSLRQAGGAAQSGLVINALTSPASTLPVIQVFNDNPDRLVLLTPIDSTVAVVASNCHTGDTSVAVDQKSGAAFLAGDLIMLSDYQNGVLLRLVSTGVQNVQGVLTTSLIPASPLVLSSPYPAGSVVLRVSSMSYGIQLGSAVLLPGTSLLWVDEGGALGATGPRTGPVAEDIMDLQVAVGVDGINGQVSDGVLTEVGANPNDDEWVFNVPGEALPSGAQISAMRVTLVARSPQIGERLGAGRPAVEDQAAGAPDGYRWRTLTETVTIRNLNMR